MLANLLINASKYAGGATKVAARPTWAGLIEISVLDGGPGVPEAFRQHLFERFSRDAESARKVMGSGLGLFITRELARANGGDIIHRPARPRGSEFVIILGRLLRQEHERPLTQRSRMPATRCRSTRRSRRVLDPRADVVAHPRPVPSHRC